MISRSMAVGLLAAGCLTAAAGGSYLAVRQNAAEQPVAAAPAAPPSSGVAETEAVVSPKPAAEPAAPAAPSEPAVEREVPKVEPRRPVAPAPSINRRPPATRAASRTPATTEPAVPAAPQPATAAMPAPVADRPPVEGLQPVDPPARPAEPTFIEIVVPASAVIGLEIETAVTSEQARIEDRVDARVTRDVYADGRLAIPAGSRVIGGVTVVERGGKLKERARLGVRFHTLVLADGKQLPLRTETFYREGASPGAESSRKIGGAAIGGAVLGAILGGGKGAVAGAGVGAAGGTAAVMAGGRNAATLASGTVVTVKLSAPVALEVEK